jgi:hypothetical protein
VSGYGWDTSNKRRHTDDRTAIRQAVRRRAHGHCEWPYVTTQLPWVADAAHPCHAYGTDAALYDDGPPHRWAWLCGRHRTVLRDAST